MVEKFDENKSCMLIGCMGLYCLSENILTGLVLSPRKITKVRGDISSKRNSNGLALTTVDSDGVLAVSRLRDSFQNNN